MSREMKQVVRLFWLFQEEQEMAWLQQMALKGWYLTSVAVVVYTFIKGEPADTRYYGDYKSMKQHDVDEYLQVFTDCGWKYICRQGNWFYFSSPFDGNFREVYSNKQSQLEKYRYLLLTHVFVISMLIYSLLLLSRRLDYSSRLGIEFLLALVFSLLIVAIFSTLRTIGKVTSLQKSVSE